MKRATVVEKLLNGEDVFVIQKLNYYKFFSLHQWLLTAIMKEMTFKSVFCNFIPNFANARSMEIL